MKRIGLTIVGLVMAIALSHQTAIADSGGPPPGLLLPVLTGQWWQWALSIPTDQNPQLDATGQDCMIGQKGAVWFLAGVWGGGTATRACSIPEGTMLFFPVINFFNNNTPDCGQSGENYDVKKLISLIEPSIDAAQNISVTVDGKPIDKTQIQRVLSFPFATAFPKDNIFGPNACGTALLPAPLPAGIYSPSMDDGYYVLLPPPKPRPQPYTLQFHAESGSFSQDITYNLTVVPVSLK